MNILLTSCDPLPPTRPNRHTVGNPDPVFFYQLDLVQLDPGLIQIDLVPLELLKGVFPRISMV